MLSDINCLAYANSAKTLGFPKIWRIVNMSQNACLEFLQDTYFKSTLFQRLFFVLIKEFVQCSKGADSEPVSSPIQTPALPKKMWGLGNPF